MINGILPGAKTLGQSGDGSNGHEMTYSFLRPLEQ